MKMKSNAFLQEFMLVMGLYFIALPLSLHNLGHNPDGWVKFAWALLPAVPLAALIFVTARQVRRLDEFQQRLLVMSFSLTLGVTGFITTVLGFLENAGVPPVSIIWVFPFMMTTWGILNVWFARRYAVAD